jgi:hypothetical protein
MPGYNGQGPDGQGPVTGGGRGSCQSAVAGNRRFAETDTPRFGRHMNLGHGKGFGGGNGRRCGQGMRRGLMNRGNLEFQPFYGPEPVDELNMLKQQADSVQNTLSSIQLRISELEQPEQDSKQ